MTRQSITVSKQAFERLKEHKRDGESWTDFGNRVADLLDGVEPPDAAGECGLNSADVLTKDHIDDIANRAARRTVDELETQLR